MHAPYRTTATPEPLPVPDPGSSRSRSRNNNPIVPIPIHNASSSPSHPAFEIPPDNYIPYMDRDNGIALPPPHELSRPVTPRSPSPPLANAAPRSQQVIYQQPVRSHDFAYSQGIAPVQPGNAGPHAPFSPQSRTSTNISQYDLLSARNERSGNSSRTAAEALAGFRQIFRPTTPSNRSVERSRTPGRSAREDRTAVSPRGPRPREDLPAIDVNMAPVRNDSPTSRQRNSSTGSPLERLFKKRFRNRTSGSSGGVPDITVESPSDTTVSRASTTATVPQNHLLSPEIPSQPLLSAEDDQRPLPPLPELGLTNPSLVALQDGQLPAGFVPFTASSTESQTSAPRDYVEDKRKAPPRPATSPKSAPAYDIAPIPAGVVYPDPPGRGVTPFVASGVPLPPSPSPSPNPYFRRGSPAGQLSPLQTFLPLNVPN